MTAPTIPAPRFTVKKLKTMETQRGIAATCEIWVGKQHVASFHDKGDGSAASLYPLDADAVAILATINPDPAQRLTLINETINQLEDKKLRAQMVRKCNKGFVSFDTGHYRYITFSKPLSVLAASSAQAAAALQNSYNSFVSKMRAGSATARLINDTCQLQSIGITPDLTAHETKG